MTSMTLTDRNYQQSINALTFSLKNLLVEALFDVLPAGYELADADHSGCRNALLRLLPSDPSEGARDVAFFFSGNCELACQEHPVGEQSAVPTLWSLSSVYHAGWHCDPTLSNSRLQTCIIGNDAKSAVIELITHVCAEPPLVTLTWRPCTFDQTAFELVFSSPPSMSESCSFERIWKSGRKWATLTGESFSTSRLAKQSAEAVAATRICRFHAERLAGLGGHGVCHG